MNKSFQPTDKSMIPSIPLLSDFSISSIVQNSEQLSADSIRMKGGQNKSIKKCFEEVEKQERQRLLHKLAQFERQQNLMKHKLQNYVKILEKEIKKKEQVNVELREHVQDLKNQYVQMGKDIEVLDKVLLTKSTNKDENRKITRQIKSEIRVESRVGSDEKEKRKQMSGRKEEKKLMPTKRSLVKSTSGKKKSYIQQKGLKQLIS